jgi:uncharacterized membrane protein YebE (DUF533 family)
MESQFLSVIRVWAALAWADGVIAPAEAKALHKLIDGAKLSDEERAIAHGFLDQPVDLSTANLAGLSDSARQGIYRAAVRMASVDLQVTEEERAALDHLRRGLGLDEKTAADIEHGVLP